MSKRKAIVNDIIYELDNDDIEISSDDEGKEAKIHRLEDSPAKKPLVNEAINDISDADIINLDCSVDSDCVVESLSEVQNGGKTSDLTNESTSTIPEVNTATQTDEVDSVKKNTDTDNSTIFNEDIVIDSPASTSDLGVVGCENRTPLVSIRFKDQKMAKSYKEKVKAFMLNLIKLHDEENVTGSENETDLELDVWPEDLLDPDEKTEEEDNLFFVDTAPGMDSIGDIPTYRKNSTLISNIPEREPTPPPVRRGPTCFNCDGAHALKDCKLPRNNSRIADNRKHMTTKVGRYHIEDKQKYGHLVPGRISGQLRHALGLKRHELPMHIYRMRLLGYPPGWLTEARISHSGITMFDSTGRAIQDPEEEDGEVCEPGSKDKFDIKKILDFPGFNVPASSRYTDESHLLGMPPISEQDSKMAMLQILAPNAVKAYKRKKLALFPSASVENSMQEGQAEMDLDSGDETAEFPSVPPLPDEAPPPAPPPPPPPASEDTADVEVLQVMKVTDIPVPANLSSQDEEKSQATCGKKSPSLDDLEERKRRLLNALDGDGHQDGEGDGDATSMGSTISMNSSVEDNDPDTVSKRSDEVTAEDSQRVEIDSQRVEIDSQRVEIDSQRSETDSQSDINEPAIGVNPTATNGENTNKNSISEESKTPEEKTGHVKSSEYGTPVMNIASSYTKLPTDDKFAKDICDVINFENLPNSTGKYKQICSLLKKVKGEVDRIQES